MKDGKMGKKQVQSLSSKLIPVNTSNNDINLSTLMQHEVIEKLTNDAISDVAKRDKLILLLGQDMFQKNVRNKLRRGEYTRAKMRLVAKALIKAQEKVNSELEEEQKEEMSWYKLMKCSYFKLVVESVKAVSGGTEESFQTPSNALKLGYAIKELADLKCTEAQMDGDVEGVDEATDFRKLVSRRWCPDISALACATISEGRFNKIQVLPEPEDLQKLSQYLLSETKKLSNNEWEKDDFKRGVTVVEAYLLLFNKRRPGELESVE